MQAAVGFVAEIGKQAAVVSDSPGFATSRLDLIASIEAMRMVADGVGSAEDIDRVQAHLKRTFMGREVVVAITAGSLDLGPWEQIFYYELDGRRDKRVLVKIIGE